MQIKLIIWDLDDTLWQGTLADGDHVVLNERRAELVHACNARGVVSSICSNNDRGAGEEQLRALGLWDQFVFPRIAFAPKPEAIRQIIADMQLRPANVLFVDDNPHVLAGARHLLPELHTLDANSPDADAVLEAVLAAQPDDARSRLDHYRMLERKAVDRGASTASDEAFLFQCDIRATASFWMDNLDFVDRIVELVNRSNQLNYTGSRLEAGELTKAIIDVWRYDSWSIFAWDRYGDYGLVGFVMVDRRAERLIHFAFSCRIMHMGIESYALNLALGRRTHLDIDISVLGCRVAPRPVPWIRDMPFNDPNVRERLRAQFDPQAGGDKNIRVMWECQSGAVAHFSAHRDRIEFDNAPRHFSLQHMIPNSGKSPLFKPLMVYGAAVDYINQRWENLLDLLDDGLFEACVELFCNRATEEKRRVLVILPPEDAPEALYLSQHGFTLERTLAFNAIWRRVAAAHESIELFELTGFVKTTDMSDASHYQAPFLKSMAEVVDRWIAASEDDRPHLVPRARDTGTENGARAA